MCDLHPTGQESAPAPWASPSNNAAGIVARSRAPGGRRRLWDLRPDYHCSICGTSLSLADLRKVAVKAGLRLDPAASEHAIHSHFVRLASQPGRAAKSMQKLLDRKHRGAVERSRRMRTEAELRSFWAASLKRGDVSGPYWAVMTHPLATETLMVEAFGDVHMLSHLLGASVRADLRKLNALERELEALSEELARVRRRAAERDAEARRSAASLTREAERARSAENRLAEANARLQALTRDGAHREAQRRMDALEARLEEASRAGRDECRRRTELENEASRLRRERDELHSLVRGLRAECGSLEFMLASGIREVDEPCGPPLDLGGRRIAYVGGRAGLIGHFRSLIRRSNGELIHHDGGVDDSTGRLGRVLGQADAVLCPVDCVSHGACLHAKQFCKRAAKPFVPLRSAGLSSFVNGLREVLAAKSHPPTETIRET